MLRLESVLKMGKMDLTLVVLCGSKFVPLIKFWLLPCTATSAIDIGFACIFGVALLGLLLQRIPIILFSSRLA
jgi:hypothetical protein